MVPRAGVEPARPFGQRILSPLTALLTTFCYMIPGSIYRRFSRQSKLTSQRHHNVTPSSFPHLGSQNPSNVNTYSIYGPLAGD